MVYIMRPVFEMHGRSARFACVSGVAPAIRSSHYGETLITDFEIALKNGDNSSRHTAVGWEGSSTV
jgi:hypothetical protein